MAAVAYCTLEEVKRALDVKETSRSDTQISRGIQAAARSIYGLTHRRFYPQLATRYFDWPSYSYARPWRLWLDSNELISVTTLVAGGATIAPGDYFLRRSDDLDEPPYTHLEIDLSSSAALAPGDTPQRAIAITGLWGYSNDEEIIGVLSADLAASASATATVTWSTAGFGTGDILRVDSERVIIASRSMVDSTQNLGTPLTASVADVTVAVTNGTAFAVGEILLLNSERMLIVDIAGNNLTVKRAWDGSVLAAHAGSDIFALTGVELARGQLGTTLAAHTNGASIYRYLVPPLVRELAIAEAINTLLQETSGYGRTVGAGENQQEASGRGLAGLRDDVYTTYGRKARIGAI